MSARCSKRGSITQAIKDGIARRGFHIVSAPAQIPGCQGSRSVAMKHIHQFARENGWHLAVHDENGWLLFTADHLHARRLLESPPTEHTNFIDALLQRAYLPSRT